MEKKLKELEETVKRLEKELAEEKGRAESAIGILNQCRLHALARLLNIPLGASISENLLEAVQQREKALEQAVEMADIHLLQDAEGVGARCNEGFEYRTDAVELAAYLKEKEGKK